MIGWWILGILLLVLLLLCLTRVGVLIRFGEELSVSARFSFLKFQVSTVQSVDYRYLIA